MRENIRVFILKDYAWQAVQETIESNPQNEELENNIAIYKLSELPLLHFAILSMDEQIDAIVIEKGVIEIYRNNGLFIPLKDKRYLLLYGSPDLLNYLP